MVEQNINLSNKFIHSEEALNKYPIIGKQERLLLPLLDFDHNVQDDLDKKLQDNPAFFDILKEGGFVDKDNSILDIPYRFNELGFRGPKLDYSKTYTVVLGCSDTFGSSQFEEKTWGSIVGSTLNFPIFNGGIPGGSLDSCYLTLKYLEDKIKFNKVIILIPNPNRGFMHYENKGEFKHMSLSPNISSIYNNDPKLLSVAKTIYSNTYSNELYSCINIQKNLEAILGICSKHKARLIHAFNPTGARVYNNSNIVINHSSKIRARDLRHFGYDFQKSIADYFIKKLE